MAASRSQANRISLRVAVVGRASRPLVLVAAFHLDAEGAASTERDCVAAAPGTQRSPVPQRAQLFREPSRRERVHAEPTPRMRLPWPTLATSRCFQYPGIGPD
jgi:hypothetical protein